MWLQIITFSALAIYATSIDPETFLTKYGYYNPFAFDGKSGLEDAVKSYQEFSGLPQTGVVDAETKKEMKKPRCGMSDLQISTNAYFKTTTKWHKSKLTYYIYKGASDMAMFNIRKFLRWSFGVWAEVTNLEFEEIYEDKADMRIGWEKGNHGDGSSFDGSGGTLAHAFYPPHGILHFDGAETWGRGLAGTDFYSVAIHEIGHALGLKHSKVRGSIMWPTYSRLTKLHQDDIDGIQSLYGKK
ncbi:72 kDa type IV collagenase-like [Hydractinia symbiolongicarpus]|uniref:72 kDa type IV collagenase-like n=1 Tax=Hydractinia symbiolongicarpus TaxID=13093 RepID=UPI0025504FBA|nr:72 kDa type IV collagenase-like [Hydractinia symbiolongicarpus]